MNRILSYNIKLEVEWDDGLKETVDASQVNSKEIEWFLDGMEEDRRDEKEWEEEDSHADES